MIPLYPLPDNPIYSAIPYFFLYEIYTALLYIGIIVYLANLFKTSSNKYGKKCSLMQIGLLLVLTGLWLVTISEKTTLLPSITMITGGLLVFYIPFMMYARLWKIRVILSMLCMLIALFAFLVGLALLLPKYNIDIKILLGTIARFPITLLAISWISILIGLLLLSLPLNEIAKRTGISVLSHLIIILIIGYLLTPLIIGIPILSLALIIMAAKIIKIV